MCGIAGIIGPLSKSSYENRANILLSLKHRGPDNQNYWKNNNIMLFHSRLSIVDLSRNANQPMKSRCGRYILSYNGEIYNSQKIKSQIVKNFGFNHWMSNSDTEILLNALILYVKFSS